jgi:hypothetical protein
MSDHDGGTLACKVFDSHGLTKAVQVALLGAPNPYQWNEDAARCALLRRRILTRLVPVWFGRRLRVADASAVVWNERHDAFELQCEFSPGAPPALAQPLRRHLPGEVRELAALVMTPLQERLIEAGFVGLVWQAGRGNPVAANNFLREPDGTWVWIDLESGIPAVIPLDPRALVRFYLPHAFERRRPLFDDVDIERLREYLASSDTLLRERLSTVAYGEILHDVEVLETRQRHWKSLGRRHQMIGYRLARGEIGDAMAERYRTRPVLWYRHEAVRAVRSLGRLLVKGVKWLGRLVAPPAWWRGLRAGGRFLVSQQYRESVARGYVLDRVIAWRRRDQLTRGDAMRLRDRLDQEQSSIYITDFGVHIAIKPFAKMLEYWVAPALLTLGIIGPLGFALLLLGGGAMLRTAYTAGRLVQSIVLRRERPWIALFTGTVPVVGNFAFPLQIFYSSTEDRDDLARFLIVDAATRAGRKVPIWGGADTLTEHWFNRFADGALRWLRRRG